MSQSQPFRTDALRPSSLPSANLGRRNPSSLGIDNQNPNVLAGAGAGGSDSSEARRKALLEVEYQKWNERIDRDVMGVIDGLKDIISLADITSNPTELTSSTLPLHLPLRTSSLIRSSINLRDIAHELKLLLVLGDEERFVQLRDNEFHSVREEVRQGREGIIDLLSPKVMEGDVELHQLPSLVEEKETKKDESGSTVEKDQSVKAEAESEAEAEGSRSSIPQSTEAPPEIDMDIDPPPPSAPAMTEVTEAAVTASAPAPTLATAPQTENVQAISTTDQTANEDDDEDENEEFEEVS